MGITTDEIRALVVISEGELVIEGWHDEGTVESGPTGGTLYGYEHESDLLQLTSNGSVILYRAGFGPGALIHSSSEIRYTGIGSMISDHLRAVARNAERNGLEFVSTGRRPETGHYSLAAILEREAGR